MVPLSEFTAIKENATLGEAVISLRELKQNSVHDHNIHRSLVVMDNNGKVVGKLSQLDLILGLEEGYRKIGDLKRVARSGYDPKYIKSMIEKNRMWEQPLDEICRKAIGIKVRDIMYAPTRGEYLDAEASLDVAIHQLGLGRHQALLVTEKDRVVGVLRLSDIFDVVDKSIQKCNLDSRPDAP
jgi:CBS domain-containing protein